MHIGGLSIFSRTSSAKRINLASWHSPHSLTWRWILSLGRHQLWTFKPYAFGRALRHGHAGIGGGFGQFIAFRAWRDNNGWQLAASLLWHALEFSQQPPMWYRDIYMRERDEELERDFASQRAPMPVSAPDHPTLQ